MPNLFPVFDLPAVADPEQASLPNYPKSLLFDFEQGDFVFDGAGRPVEADGYTAWVQWCQFAVLTERFAHLIYSPDFGAEITKAKNQPNRAAVQSYLEREISEALMIDPRTETVRSFSYAWSGDSLTVSFEIVPTVGEPTRLEVNV